VSIAAIHPPAAVYREEQNFGWWVYAVVSAIMLLGLALLAGPFIGGSGVPAGGSRVQSAFLGVCVGMILPPVLVLGVLRMTTEVAPGSVRVWFGWVPTYRRLIDLSAVVRIEVVQYRPFRDYGGWGIRIGRDGERVLNARGDRGVRLFFSDQQKLLIGSQKPEALAAAIERAMQPVV
jgi:hypothetical protein